MGGASVRRTGGTSGLVVLGHGAGGGTDAPDLQAAAAAAASLGFAVALVEQPWRVAGRRVAEAPARLDAAWTAVVAQLERPPGPLVVGGRSAGARVACRTAAATGADAVLALAFPLVAPSGRSRAHELALPEVPRLVVQGSRDAFGVPEAAPGTQVHVVEGADHAFAVRRKDGRTPEDVAATSAAVQRWLAQTVT
ncbi:MAG TPA: alpha/beta family hydrolase [Mycobacteriales bacterium]|nr:alpha/beta family hydrolase [Mycobacteriales bacterium]